MQDRVFFQKKGERLGLDGVITLDTVISERILWVRSVGSSILLQFQYEQFHKAAIFKVETIDSCFLIVISFESPLIALSSHQTVIVFERFAYLFSYRILKG